MAAIKNLAEQVSGLIDRVSTRYAGWLPFGGKYLLALKVFLVRNLDAVAAGWDRFTGTDGDAHHLIDYLVTLARGNVKLPFYAAPFAPFLAEALRAWLHANVAVVRGPVGVLPAK